MTGPPTSSRAQFAAQFGRSVRRLQQHLAPRLMSQMAGEMQDYDLSFSQMGSLFQLRARGELTVSALAERAHLSVPAASHLVERLVRRGLLARREDPANRRQKLVALSEKGRALLERFERLTTEAYAALLADVPEDVLRRAEAALNKLTAYLPEPCPPGSPAAPPEKEMS